MLKKLAAISLTAGVLVLMAPAVASASPVVPTESDSYAGTPRVSVDDPIIDICEVSTVVFGAGYFLPSENVGVSVSGLNAGDSAVSGNTAAADGSLVVTFRPPADGEGSYALAFDGSRSYTATITVSHGHDSAVSCDHDPGVAAAGTELPLTGGGLELALTGGSVSPWVLGGGAAALVAGGVLVATGVTRRKRA
ncbi:hypothetical protein SOM10_00260 [Microbacterium sp. CFBP9023]|uniref:hypothetical protein n=1 Tax=unclassified Microbacterium TaxID=2609290 RepID=UPI00069FDD43|nr:MULTISPECIES: hypothetical protein [unclassified Microbacterium]AKV85161.1 hypothetical protein AKG07_01345 [Microbacterium sp. CGR1]KRD51713.1 hypothetical protein ASE34_07150 [Microbacterium sp. Root280D1]MDY0982314.1 hypothetical protein [Microbacterium sp. CFBP9023]CAH0165580.1 hypothetical protein SRABI98_01137 [Microbacterium sp. Bi98]